MEAYRLLGKYNRNLKITSLIINKCKYDNNMIIFPTITSKFPNKNNNDNNNNICIIL